MTKHIKSIALLSLLIILGCSSLDKNQAEWAAKNFVKDRVKFFSSDQEEKHDVPQYEITEITSYEQDRIWTVVLHIESNVSNATKDNDLELKVDRKGQIIEFNGQKLK